MHSIARYRAPQLVLLAVAASLTCAAIAPPLADASAATTPAALASVHAIAENSGEGTISGTVSNAHGGVSGICVYALSDTGASPKAGSKSTTDAAGNYVLTVAPDTYDVHFNGCGAVGVQPPSTVLRVVVTAGRDTKVDVTAPLVGTTMGTISGHVTYANGTPVPALCLTWTGRASGFGKTDHNGYYEVTDLPSGTYTVDFDTCAAPAAKVRPVVASVKVTAGATTTLNETWNHRP